MSTITKERIANLIEFNSEGSDCQANAEQWEVHELARIALTSLEAEPVADVVAWSSQNEERTCDVRLRRHDIKPGILYTAPPAPVVPDEMVNNIDNPYGDEDLIYEEGKIEGWNACRATMLQAGNSPVTPNTWIPVSERMPDNLIPVMVMYADGEMWSAMWSGQFWDDGCTIPDPHAITHWREMPAAPQQEDL